MSKEDILKELEDYSTIMFGTPSENGGFDFRPMAIAKREKDYFYFITSLSSGKTSSIENNHEVILVAQSSSSFISVKGRGSISEDYNLLKELWNPNFQAWFPEDPSDPDVCLVTFTPSSGEIWDNGVLKKAKYIWEMISSNISGKKASMPENHDSF